MRGSLRNVSVMPAKAGIQTRPHVPEPWIPAYAGMTQHQIDQTRRRLESMRPRSATAYTCASDSDSMSNKPVQSPPEILSYTIKVFVPLMNERARMGVLDRPRQVPIGGPPLIGRESNKTFEDGRKVGV
jgi:hypothetical protein